MCAVSASGVNLKFGYGRCVYSDHRQLIQSLYCIIHVCIYLWFAFPWFTRGVFYSILRFCKRQHRTRVSGCWPSSAVCRRSRTHSHPSVEASYFTGDSTNWATEFARQSVLPTEGYSCFSVCGASSECVVMYDSCVFARRQHVAVCVYALFQVYTVYISTEVIYSRYTLLYTAIWVSSSANLSNLGRHWRVRFRVRVRVGTSPPLCTGTS
jgi:hypothetical protein